MCSDAPYALRQVLTPTVSEYTSSNMGKGGQGAVASSNSGRQLSWEEVRQHTKREDKWLVIDNSVYDISRWQKKHPGGAKIISHYAGEDATVSGTMWS